MLEMFSRVSVAVMVFLTTTLVRADELSEIPTHSVDNDGASALVISEPDYYQVPNAGSHVGMAVKGTRVKVIATRRDRAVPVLEWSQIKILSGDMKGKTGWVSSKTLHPLSKSEIDRYRELAKDAAENPQKTQPKKIVEFYTIDNSGDPAMIVNQPVYTAAANAGSRVGIAPAGTIITVLEKKQDQALTILSWYKIRVESGDLKGKVGWVTSNAVAAEPVTLEFLVKTPTGTAASRLSRSANLISTDSCDLLDTVTLECRVSSEKLEPSKYSFEIRQQGIDNLDWHSIATGTDSKVNMKTVVPGEFELRVVVTLGTDSTLESSIESLEVQFPTVNQILADAKVEEKLKATWNEMHTVFFQPAKPGEKPRSTRREHGFYILIDTATEQYTFTEVRKSDPVSPEGERQVNLGSYRDEHPSRSPVQPGRFVVASFHTHTPLLGNRKERPFGASKGDLEAAKTQELPGIVYDYSFDLFTDDIRDKMAEVTTADVSKYYGRPSAAFYFAGEYVKEIEIGIVAWKNQSLDLSPFGKPYPYGLDRRPSKNYPLAKRFPELAK